MRVAGTLMREGEKGSVRVDPYKYLLWVLREAPKLFETDREWAKKLTPEHCTQH